MPDQPGTRDLAWLLLGQTLEVIPTMGDFAHWSFFEKQKLTGPNFIDWYKQLQLVLSTEDKEKYLEQPIPVAPVAAAPDQPIPPATLTTYNGELKALYSKQAEHELLQTENKNKKPSKAAKGVQGKGKGKKAYAYAKLSYAPKPKNPPPTKKDNPVKDAICHHCGEVDGFINRFELNNEISVSKNNVVYFTAIPRDGLYEIEMSCSNTNDSSIYVVSNKRAKLNESSLLWHCRLGHISKKRIKMLQHDGLLNSTDIESLGKYVSCMSGKMARKPYSHQVERAKDLLGLIHTDNAEFFESNLIDQEASGSLEDLEIIQEEDTNPSLDTGLNHEEDNQELDEPQSDINPIRRSKRTCRPTD
ncbi:retrotransposon protein, putative, ty1-copia subclass [Tanacetum coccineum]